MDIRESLLLSQRAARDKEAAELLPRVGEPLGSGSWSVKDHLAHLAAWRSRAADILGGVFEPMGDLDEFNARLYAETKDLPAQDVLAGARDSWARLIGAIEGLTAEKLRGPVPEHPRQELWTVVPGNGHLHLAEHLAFIAEALGDHAAADAVQVWARDLVVETFEDAASMSHAEYNLGCYYAKAGRAGMALPYLERALALNPDLREHAEKDPDLDPIRGESGFAAALGPA